MTLDEIVAAMVEHSAEHPSHAYNCACRDQWIREARARLSYNELAELRYLADVLWRTR